MTDFLDGLGSALISGAKGAGAGAVLGPIGAAAGGLLGVATSVVPGLQHLIAGNADAIAKTEAVVKTVTGTDDPDAAQAAVQDDPAVRADLEQQLAAIASDNFKAALADVAGARATTVQLAQAGSPLAWGAAVVSVVVLVAFGAALSMMLLHAIPPGAEAVVNVLVGSLTAMATSVVSYWVGSSVGSARKDARLAAQQQ